MRRILRVFIHWTFMMYLVCALQDSFPWMHPVELNSWPYACGQFHYNKHIRKKAKKNNILHSVCAAFIWMLTWIRDFSQNPFTSCLRWFYFIFFSMLSNQLTVFDIPLWVDTIKSTYTNQFGWRRNEKKQSEENTSQSAHCVINRHSISIEWKGWYSLSPSYVNKWVIINKVTFFSLLLSRFFV